MKELDLLSAGLNGLNLIEASAGTGKTFTITGLYARLVLELDCRVERLLVVTFTDAATAELRERIRHRLVTLLQAFEQGESNDPFCREILARNADPARAQRRLRLAVLGFDQAAIFTIHGFCQRVLSEHAFESGLPFESELISEQHGLLQEIAADFWRRRVQDLSPGLLDFLLAKKIMPETLLAGIKKGIGRPFLSVRSAGMPADLPQREASFQHAFERARSLWKADGETIRERLRSSTGLSGRRYRGGWLETWFRQMDDYLNAPPGAPFDQFIKFTTGELATSLKKGGVPPEHPFFDACESLREVWNGLAPGYARALAALKKDLLCYCNRELAVRKAAAGVQSFDDLILNFYTALSGRHGARLIETIRQRYASVLIDEFQDTDPVQYRIFSMITHGSGLPVFLVGDPKQAIYSFRGADIFAYHQAREEAEARYTLKTNWRSDPGLITAVNALFKARRAGFFYDWIPFHEARAAEKTRDMLQDDDTTAPFRIWQIPDEGKAIPVKEASRLAASATAVEIARLLRRGADGKARIGERNLEGGDIAVLVRSHWQGEMIARQLRERGVYSVRQSRESVFHSQEAAELLWVLSAVAEPAREARIMTALATEMLGLDGEAIECLRRDEWAQEAWREKFRGYHQLWRESGFVRMFHQLLSGEQVAQRLLEKVDGERRFTNLQHLGELLHQHDSARQPGMEGLLKWLLQQRQSAEPMADEQELRLESDEGLVQIVTIHKSKGLEYPVVFCPFLWADSIHAEKGNAPYCFHDEQKEYQPVLELGSERMDADREFAIREEQAENLRLLYVALTRAVHRCYTVWGNIQGIEKSAMGWLLGYGADIQGALDAFVKRARGTVRIETLPKEEGGVIQFPARRDEIAPPRRFDRHFDLRFGITSFTALSSGHGVDQPDYDGQVSPSVPTVIENDIFGFPRGARAGCCIHGIFERLDFAACRRGHLETLVEDALRVNGFDSDWMPVVADMVESVLNTPLDREKTLYLKTVKKDQRLLELEFCFPLSSISAEGVRDILLRHDFASETVLRQAVEKLSFADVRGFMKGFIDLVFEAGGRFYLVDYKSNWLGDSLDDYAKERLHRVIAQQAYYLQYLLYSLALHRYLALRLPGYDYERHFGGVFYLFVRGMRRETGPEYGIYRDRPSRQLIEVLDRYLVAPPP